MLDLNIDLTSFIHGATLIPHINVQWPALYTLKNVLNYGFKESHKKFTSVKSANSSEFPAINLIGCLIWPKSHDGG